MHRITYVLILLSVWLGMVFSASALDLTNTSAKVFHNVKILVLLRLWTPNPMPQNKFRQIQKTGAAPLKKPSKRYERGQCLS